MIALAAFRPSRRRPRSLRGHAGHDRSARWAGPRSRLHLRLGPRSHRCPQSRHPLPRHRPARDALEGVWEYWNRTLGAVHVETPDHFAQFPRQRLAALSDARLPAVGPQRFLSIRRSVWLPRSASGCHGPDPRRAGDPSREHLLRCAARQFREGDVQHWWHPPAAAACARTSPTIISGFPTPRADTSPPSATPACSTRKQSSSKAAPLKPDEDSYYDLPTRSDESGTLYEHCVRAIKHGLRFGEHGLPLMGSGDWNDGMNLVGEHGKGESVWLAFFLYDVLAQFARARQAPPGRSPSPISAPPKPRKLRDEHRATRLGRPMVSPRLFRQRRAARLGRPIPNARSIPFPQSWSRALQCRRPRAPQARLSRQLDQSTGETRPRRDPIVRSRRSIKSRFESRLYQRLRPRRPRKRRPIHPRRRLGRHGLRRIRQHRARVGTVQSDQPLHHGDTEAAIATYKVEPYVVAADVYTNPQHAGRGGWTWYTGSAGWMYRLITESLLGLHLEVDRLRLTPLHTENLGIVQNSLSIPGNVSSYSNPKSWRNSRDASSARRRRATR